MDWYCAHVKHLLHTTDVGSSSMSFESVLEQLKQKVVQLYKAILLYQMKSVCSYYRNQGWNFILQLWNFDDWDGALDSVEQAENHFWMTGTSMTVQSLVKFGSSCSKRPIS